MMIPADHHVETGHAGVPFDGGSGPVVEVDELTIRTTGTSPREIVRSLSLSVAPGEAVALVGESGSGKSLTARSLLGLLPDGVEGDGRIRVGPHELGGMRPREVAQMRGSEIALVMQDPFTMLNPLERCGHQIVAKLRSRKDLSLSSRELRAEAVRRLSDVGITEPHVADLFPFELSGGMRQRVGIAAAIAENPKVLVADEPTTALDVMTQDEILQLIDELRRRHSMGLILITHDLSVAFAVCDRVYVIYAGSIVEAGTAASLIQDPRHPYTRGLLDAQPSLDRRVAELASIPGHVPTPGLRPKGCVFAPRCTWSTDACTRGAEPDLEPHGDRLVRCRRLHEIALTAPARETVTNPVDRNEGAAESVDAMLSVHALTKFFARRGRNAGRTVALDGVDIEVGAGESIGLVGESGSGKSTLARCIVGLERADSGRVLVAGHEVVHLRAMSSDQRRYARENVQMVFQDPYSSLNPSRSVGATLREAIGHRSDVTDRQDEAAELLSMVGLPSHYLKRRPSVLSGGERQRVAIARALALRPWLLVCDEVTSALDVSVQAQVLNLLARLQRELGLSYLFVTHDLAVVRQITDRVYVLQQGSVVEHGPTGEVLDHPAETYTRRLIESIPTPESNEGD